MLTVVCSAISFILAWNFIPQPSWIKAADDAVTAWIKSKLKIA